MLCHILFPFRRLAHFDIDGQNKKTGKDTQQHKCLKLPRAVFSVNIAVLKQNLSVIQIDPKYGLKLSCGKVHMGKDTFNNIKCNGLFLFSFNRMC